MATRNGPLRCRLTTFNDDALVELAMRLTDALSGHWWCNAAAEQDAYLTVVRILRRELIPRRRNIVKYPSTAA